MRPRAGRCADGPVRHRISQNMCMSIEGGPGSCAISLPHRNDTSTLFLNFDLELFDDSRPGEVQVLHLQGNATVLRLLGGEHILVTAASVTSRPSAMDSEDGVEEDVCLKGVYLLRTVGSRQTDRQPSLGNDVTLEDMSKVDGVRSTHTHFGAIYTHPLRFALRATGGDGTR